MGLSCAPSAHGSLLMFAKASMHSHLVMCCAPSQCPCFRQALRSRSSNSGGQEAMPCKHRWQQLVPRSTIATKGWLPAARQTAWIGCPAPCRCIGAAASMPSRCACSPCSSAEGSSCCCDPSSSSNSCCALGAGFTCSASTPRISSSTACCCARDTPSSRMRSLALSCKPCMASLFNLSSSNGSRAAAVARSMPVAKTPRCHFPHCKRSFSSEVS
mmetsp:Transcript_129424/g.335649  ORF Transcript_129424/g.335649 Transcript_129424/m.335649 type:complete len:215 (-) Transcript_129424:1323-1967(-)